MSQTGWNRIVSPLLTKSFKSINVRKVSYLSGAVFGVALGTSFVIQHAACDESVENTHMREKMDAYIRVLQKNIVSELENVDGKRFRVDKWNRPEGGDGISCVLQDGNVFEKAGVNISVVYGKLPPPAIKQMKANHKTLDYDTDAPDAVPLPFFAAGISMVLHPHNPMAPTVHMNYRYFEIMGKDGKKMASWFGGGTDLTPSYLFEEDAQHFHKTIREACDHHDASYYPKFKAWCDKYFYIPHRGESRGIGGIFFDDFEPNETRTEEQLFSFIKECGNSVVPSYLPILLKRKDSPFTEEQKHWQALRRGRYVEFNLVYDRGTKFGLNTPGARIESVLMSLPLYAQWEYMAELGTEPGSDEAKMLAVLRKPIEWA